MKTIHAFYKDNALYAWTLNEALSEKFKTQRNMDKFTYKKIRMRKEPIRIFNIHYKKFGLIEVPLGIGNKSVYIVGTYEEDEKFTLHIEDLGDMIEKSYHDVKKWIKDTEWEDEIGPSVDYLYKQFSYVKKDSIKNKTDKVLNLDEIYIFFEMFKDTF